MTLWTQHVRHAFRALKARPLHAALVILAFALGIGLNTPLVATAARLFTAPLPYPDADRLVVPWPGNAIPSALLGELHGSSPSFEELAITWDVATVEYQDPDAPAGRVVGYRARQVSRNFFDLFGLHPVVGRPFTDADVPPRELWSSPTRIMLTWHAWVELFGGDPSVVGRSVDQGTHSTRIVGVMPPEATPLARGADAWSLVAFVSQVVGQPRWMMEAVGRLAPGISLEQARTELEGRLARYQAETDGPVIGQWSPRPVFGPTSGTLGEQTLVPLRLDLAGNTRGGLLLLVAAGLATLLIAVVNASALGLHGSVGRSRDVAVRRALGAERRHLLGLVLAEQGLLALGGGTAALGLAWLGNLGLRRVLPEELPYGIMGGMTGDLVGWALVTSIVCALVSTAVSVVPILHSGGSGSPGGPGELASGGRTQTVTRRSLRGLLALQVALISILMVGAGVLLRSVDSLREVDAGFDPERIVVLRPQAAGLVSRNPDAAPSELLSGYFERVIRGLEGLPFVTAAGQGPVPFSFPTEFRWEVTDGGRSPEPGRPDIHALSAMVGEGALFDVLGVQLLRGRTLVAEDAVPEPGQPQAVVANRTFTRGIWDETDPVGRTFHVIAGVDRTLTFRVVGVVESFRFFRLDRPPEPQFWMRVNPASASAMPLLVRVEGEAGSRVDRLVEAFGDVDPRVPLVGAQPMTDLVTESIRSRTAALRILLCLAGLGLLLALLGIYGVVSLNASSRVREIGIRRALGARTASVLGVVVGRDAAWVVGGLVVGLAVAIQTTPLLESMLYGVRPFDPTTFVAVPVSLLAVAALAAAVPALRALRLDPSRTLREE